MSDHDSERIRVLLLIDGTSGPALCRALKDDFEMECVEFSRAIQDGLGQWSDPPDVVLIDLDSDEAAAIAVSRTIRARYPRAKVLLLSWYEDARMQLALMRSAAVATVIKSLELQPLRAAILAHSPSEPPDSPLHAQKDR